MDLRRRAQKEIASSGLECELYISRNKSLRINIQDKKVESIESGDVTGCAARVVKEKRTGFSFSNSDNLKALIGQAASSSAFMPQDPFSGFTCPGSPLEEMRLFDTAIEKKALEEKIRAALSAEEAAYSASPLITKTGSVSYVDSETEITIVNSNGINCNYKSNCCGVYVEAICEKDGHAEEGLGFTFAKDWDRLDTEHAGKEAGLEAVSLLGGELIDSAKLPAVMSPLVAAEFLEAVSAMAFAESVQKGKSAFAGKLEKKIASACVSITDNALLKNGLNSAPFDGEGSPSKINTVVREGVLQTYLYDHYTALKDKVKTTSSACRSSFKSLPSIGTTNFYISPGKNSQNKLLSKLTRGLLITKVMAMHSVNPISGDFSVGASGFMIENGQRTFPVRGITIAGNLLELLHAIEEVGSDLTFSPFASNCGSPSLLISSLSIGGR